MRLVRRSVALATSLVFMIGLADLAFGQVPDSATGTLVGRVIDTTGATIAGADVIVTRSGDSAVVGTTTSNKKGNVKLEHLPVGGSYTVTARKIGYGAARGEVRFHTGDTLYIDFELPPLAVVLAPITVTARRNRFSIAAGQFNPKHYRDALWLLADRRKDMLGDPERCPPPDPTFGGPSRDGVNRIRINDRLMIGGGSREARRERQKWLSAENLMAFVPQLPYVQQLYVNGQRVDWRPFNGQVVPGRSVGEELQRIPLDQIVEIRYVDCWDESVPPHMQYGLYVTLKPPSRAVQDSILRSIMKQPPAPR